jgi:acyl dehydratase
MALLYLEDFKVGDVFEASGPILSEADMIEFSRRYDPQVFHVDQQGAKESIYGGIIASGWQTVAYCMRMICDAYLLRAASLGSPGMNEIRWLKPVRPGDSLRMRMTVKEVRPSQSKPDRGVVLHQWDTFNQQDELIMTMSGYGMFRRKPHT